jgi:hypothetical protein
MQTSETINELAAALAKAQGQFTTAPRSAHDQHTGKNYATLADVLDVCREHLAANDLAIVQTPEPVEETSLVVVSTRLMHSSGQWIEGITRFPVVNIGKQGARLEPDARSIMSALTYARRAGIASILGIAPDADDDGSAASGKPQPAVPAPKAVAPDPNGVATPEQLKAITGLCGEKYDPEGTVRDWYNATMQTLTNAQAADCIKKLSRKPQQQGASA